MAVNKQLPASAFPRAALGDNPSQEALRRFVQDFFISPPPSWYLIITGVSGGFLLCVVTVIGFLLVKRLREGSLWLFRFEKGVVCPNTLMSFISVISFYVLAFIVWMGLQFGTLVTRTVSPIVNGFFQTFLWTSLWFAGWCAGWGTLWAIPHDVLSGNVQIGVKHRWSARTCNGFFFGMPAILLAPVLWASIESVQLWASAVHAWKRFDHIMLAAADPHALATKEQLDLGIAVWQKYSAAMIQLVTTWWIWAGIAILNLFGYGLVGGMLIRSLRHHISRHLEYIATTGAAHQLTTELRPGEVPREQHFFPALKPKLQLRPKTRAEELEQAVRNLQINYGATQTVTGACMSIAILNAATILDRVRRSPQEFAFTYQISWAIIAIVTCLGSIVVLLGVFNRELSEPVVFYWRNAMAPVRPESRYDTSPTSSKGKEPSQEGGGGTGQIISLHPAKVKPSKIGGSFCRGGLRSAPAPSPVLRVAPSLDTIALLEVSKSGDRRSGRSRDTLVSKRAHGRPKSWSESIEAACTASEAGRANAQDPSDCVDGEEPSVFEVEVLQSRGAVE